MSRIISNPTTRAFIVTKLAIQYGYLKIIIAMPSMSYLSISFIMRTLAESGQTESLITQLPKGDYLSRCIVAQDLEECGQLR
jgi:hypothetical protein